jgi:hypothetical protein
MKRLRLIGLAVAVCAGAAGLGAGWERPAGAAVQQGPGAGVAFVTVQGRLIRVEFQLASQPPTPGDPGGLLAAVRLSAGDRRGLPGDLRPVFLNVIRESELIWHTGVAPVPTFAYNPFHAFLVSTTRGPILAPGSRADTVLWLRDRRQAYRVFALSVPVAGHY